MKEDEILPSVESGADAGSALAYEGDIAVLGAPGTESLLIYEREAGDWTHAATFEGPWGFGYEIAISNGTVFAGASAQNSVHVYAREDGDWTRTDTLVRDGGKFGSSVDVTPDGETLVVGARGETTTERGGGVVYVLERAEEGWTQTARLTPITAEEWGSFGWDVSISPDGRTLAAGTLYEERAAFVFERSLDGWVQTAQLEGGGPWTSFGYGVEATPDAVLVSDYQASPGSLNVGSVHVFEPAPDGWERSQILVPTDLAPLEDHGSVHFGFSMDAQDGVVAIGAPRDDVSPGLGFPAPQEDEICFEIGWIVPVCDHPGAAYLFERADDGDWSQIAKVAPLDASPADVGPATSKIRFGSAVALGDGAATLLVGAPEDGSGLEAGPGSATLFEPWTAGEV